MERLSLGYLGAGERSTLAAVQVGCFCAYICIGGSNISCKAKLTVFSNPISFPWQIGYFLKNLDLNNVSNAYLSGMEEDLEMYGNQLVTSTSIFTVGYVIGQIPCNLLLTRLSPRGVIPSVSTHRSSCLLLIHTGNHYSLR